MNKTRILGLCTLSAAVLFGYLKLSDYKTSVPNKQETRIPHENPSSDDRKIEVATLVRPEDTMWRFSREIYGRGSDWTNLLHETGYDAIGDEVEPGRVIYLGKYPRNRLNRTARRMDRPVFRALDKNSNPNTDLIAGQLVILTLTAEQAMEYAAKHPERRLFELKDIMSISTAF